MKFLSRAGTPLPMGSSVTTAGVNFSLFSRHAEKVTLVLFQPGQESPCAEIAFDNQKNRTGDIWHMLVQDLDRSMRYGFRIAGPYDPKGSGHFFNERTILLDPYCKAISGNEKWGKPRLRGKKKKKKKEIYPLRSLIVEKGFDWEGDRPLNIPMKDSIIYEMHVRGFSRHSSAGVSNPGTYAGIVEKIPYLQELGVTAIELLPVTEFNEDENTFRNPENGKRLKNFWGYSPVSFFAPKASYAVDGFEGAPVNEFKSMVKELHKAGIEVILDIVFNHTAEGGQDGPTLSFRGLDNTIYYILDRDSGEYKNYSGCGNTFNCNHPLVRNFIIDCLHYWVIEMHVDGFRFDLASILGRDQDGEVLSNPPMVEMIAEDPILADTKIIAEAWDAAGLYQVGNFSSNVRWAEWNGKFRDDVRAFMCGRENTVAPLATRIAGSSDLYQHNAKRPFNSINFITSHDGFTLYDLVSYEQKHNQQNGEANRDGDNNNINWNSGVEGPSRSIKIKKLRARRMKTFGVILFLSQGTPMMTAGDEFCRSQQGNNNAYCQDNEISWLDWHLVKKNAAMVRFFRLLISLRKRHSIFRREEFFTSDDQSLNQDIIWQSVRKGREDWSRSCKALAFFLSGSSDSSERDNAFFVMFNGALQTEKFEIPKAAPGHRWLQIIDTAALSPADILSEEEARPVLKSQIAVAGMSAVVLMGKKKEKV